MSSTGLPATPDPVASNGGLINTAPGSAQLPVDASGQPPVPTATGAPPNAAPEAPSLTVPATTGYTPAQTTVAPNQTVAGNIKDIIASGSPLMEQAETNAKNVMNSRGLINSTQAITAGQSALYAAATPIATADAARYSTVADKNTDSTNTALQFTAGANNASAIAKLQSDTTLTAQQLQDQTSVILANTNVALQTYLGQLSSNTTLTAQQIATEAQKAVAQANNTSAQIIAGIQSNTSLSVEDKQAQSAQVIAQMNNDNAKAVQTLVNQGALANIAANGDVSIAVQKLTDDNKTLLQTSAGASQLYTQVLTNMSAIQTNNNLTQDQKTTALNDQVQQLNDALSVMSTITNTPGLASSLVFSSQSDGSSTTPAAPTGPPSLEGAVNWVAAGGTPQSYAPTSAPVPAPTAYAPPTSPSFMNGGNNSPFDANLNT